MNGDAGLVDSGGFSPLVRTFPSAAVYNNPSILAAFHNSRAGAREDSKTFVDRPLTASPLRVLAAFKLLQERISSGSDSPDNRTILNAFFQQYFAPLPESSAMPHVPVDYTPEIAPSFRLLPPDAQSFAIALKALWPELCRVTPNEPPTFPYDQTSLLPLPHPFFVAGGRFREVYYWDTFWIVKGLLASDMATSARLSVENLLHLVSLVSYVPNGNRVYYLNRSQPPMLTLTVRLILEHDTSPDMAWLERVLPLLDQEYSTFVSSHSVSHPSAPDAAGALSMYRVSTRRPRPESWVEDAETARQYLTSVNGHSPADTGMFGYPDAQRCYAHLASAAESGWDFSSRWFSSQCQGLPSTRTADIIPVCLNAILLASEESLAYFHAMLSEAFAQNKAVSELHSAAALRYGRAACERAKAINKLLWNPNAQLWCDYDINQGKICQTVAASGIFPLWAGCWPSEWQISDATAFVENFALSGLVQAGGIAATVNCSGQQWDGPNSWPPLADIVVSGLERLEASFSGCGAGTLACRVAEKTVKAMHRGWMESGVMHEKYDASVINGKQGSGGEYDSQCGFGWTNGVALDFMRRGFWYTRS
jgi:alpha,alpha-trehalase